MIATKKKEDLRPVCPHCKKELREIWYQELEKDLGKRCVYCCPECRSILGISHRKGLTFGF